MGMARERREGEHLYYPVTLDVARKKCLVVGGGAVAARKAQALALCGAKVVVVAPAIGKGIEALARAGKVKHRAKKFSAADVRGAFLAAAATDDRETNRAVFAAARRNGVLVNVVDCPEFCDFHVPAVLRRGPIAIAVSTGGASPYLAAALRDAIGKRIGPEYGRAAKELGRLRPFVKQAVIGRGQRKRIFSRSVSQMVARAERRKGRR